MLEIMSMNLILLYETDYSFFWKYRDLSMLLFYGFMIDSFWNKMETFTHVILVVRSSMNFPMASILNKLE